MITGRSKQTNSRWLSSIDENSAGKRLVGTCQSGTREVSLSKYSVSLDILNSKNPFLNISSPVSDWQGTNLLLYFNRRDISIFPCVGGIVLLVFDCSVQVVFHPGYFNGNLILTCAKKGILTAVPKPNTSNGPNEYRKLTWRMSV